MPAGLAAMAMGSSLMAQPAPAEQHSRPFVLPSSIARAISPEIRVLDDREQQLTAELQVLSHPPKNERASRIGWKVFGYGSSLAVDQWIEIDLGAVHSIDALCLVPVDVPFADTAAPGHGFPRRFRVEIDNGTTGWTIVEDHSNEDFENPGSFPVLIRTPGRVARKVRVVMTKPWEKGVYRAYALGEIMVIQGSRNLATGLSGVKVRTSASLERGPTWSRQNLIDGQSIVGAPVAKTSHALTHGWESDVYSDPSTNVWFQVDLGRSYALDEIRLLPIKFTDFSNTHGYGFPMRFRVELSDDVEFHTAHVVADWSRRSFGVSSFSPITLPCEGKAGRFVRMTAEELWEKSEGQYIFALGELQAYHGDSNVALGADVTAMSATSQSPRNFNPSYLTDGQRGPMHLIDWTAWLQELSRRGEVEQALATVQARLAVLQPRLARRVSRIFIGGVTVVVLGTLGGFLHQRRKQALAVAALQRRIAGDLHDEIGSNLAGISMMAELGHREGAGLSAADTEEIRKLAADTASAMRDIVWLTQPGPHDAPRLTERLRETARHLLKGVEWTFEIEGMDEAPALDVQRHLLLALKEMLNNVLRHAGAGHVWIRLQVDERRFSLEVRDDGCGFVVGASGDGHGLTSLRHRSMLLHGNLELASQPGKGTRVSLNGILNPVPAAPPAPA